MKKRNSRWDDEPRLDEKGQPIVVYPCATDIVIFRLLQRYRYLPIDFIVAHTGLSYSYLKHRLDVLARKPNKFLNRPDKQRAQPNANYRFLIYELAFRGETVLKDHLFLSKEPRLGDEHLFAHSLMVSETIVSLEIGHSGEMIWWPEIASRLKEPNRFIPVHIEHQFDKVKKTASFDYYNDSNGPFGIRYTDGTVRFLSLEAEHTNQVDCSNLTKTSFLKKYLAIRYLMEHKLHTMHWGIPNLITLVVTSSQARIDTMKELIMRETNGKGSSYIAFAIVPVLEDPFTAAKPAPELFTQGWQRAGHPDLFLNLPTAKKAAA
jgi:hypothetical protein